MLIKNNHLTIAGGIKKAVESVKEKHKNKVIEVETRNFKEVREALNSGADIIMLDNMNPDKIIKALKIIDKKAKTEASGGININNIRGYAKTGVDYISVGALTHSAKSLDIGLYVI